MPVFEIEAPNGKTYEVEGPDAAGAMQALQRNLDQGGSSPAPEWREPGTLVPIQFNTDGGARLAVPKLATDAWNAIQAPGKALRGEYDQLEVNPETGAVAPFDTRMMDDAANLASMVSPITPASRFAAPASAAARPALKAATPEIDDLYAAKNAAYGTVDKLGAQYSDEAIDGLYGDMFRRVSDANIDPAPDGVHKAAVRMLERLEDRRGPTSLSRLDQLRQQIRRDVIDSGTKGDAEMGGRMIAAIDDFLENAGPGQISGVTGETANFAIRTARQANTILRKAERLNDALEAARLRAAASGTGGNIDNSIRQELVRIVKDPKTFTAAEIAQMEKIIMGGGKIQDVLRTLGKLSPSGNGLMAALGIGGTMANPAAAVVPAVGLAAKAISDRATQAGVRDLTNVVRTGGSVPLPLPRIGSSLTPKANTTLLQQNFGPGQLPHIPAKIRLDA